MRLRAPTILALALLATACAPLRPVLYPNQQLQEVGGKQAQLEIEECTSLAHHYVETGEIAEVAGRTARGAVVGGAAGGAAGAVFGRTGRGAAAGAAGAAAGTLARSAFRRGPDPVVRAFVVRCLRERGYDPIGWK